MKTRTTLPAVAALMMLVMTGCAGAPSAATQTVEPAPLATGSAPTSPTTRVPLSCDQVASGADIETAVGQAIGPVSPLLVDTVPEIAPYAGLQYGQLDCAWALAPLTYNESPPLVTVAVVPAVPATYWQELVTMGVGTGLTAGGFAGDSYSSCTANGDIDSCRLDTLVNGYWLAVSVAGESGTVTAQTAAALFSSAASVVEAAEQPDDAWSHPSDSGPSGTVDTTGLGAALGASVDEILCGPTAQAEENRVAQAETGYTSCTYETSGAPDGADAFVTVSYLPGGAWALAGLSESFAGYVTAVEGLGEGAFSAPDGPGASMFVFTRGSDLVGVHTNGSQTVELTTDRMSAIATAVRSVLP